MRRQLCAAALAALVAIVESSTPPRARDLPRNFVPAQATLAAMDVLFPEPPRPTAAPDLAKYLARRDQDQTCGYLSGDPDSPLTCPEAGTCVIDSFVSYVGCCGDQCNVPTSCLPQESSDEGELADSSSTLWCSEDTLPACATVVYLDPTFLGYTGYICDSVDTTYEVYYSPFGAAASSIASFEGSSVLSTLPAPKPTAPAAGGSTPSPTATPAKTTSPASPAPAVGPIIGGVVAGVAGLGLIGLGIFFLIRRNSKKRASPAAPMPAVPALPPNGGYYPPSVQPPPQMQEHQALLGQSPAPDARHGQVPYTGGYYDPHGSMGKTPVTMSSATFEPTAHPSTGSSPPTSPTPPSYPAFVAPYPPQQQQLQQHPQLQQQQLQQQQQQYQQQQHQQHPNPHVSGYGYPQYQQQMAPQPTGYSGAGVPSMYGQPPQPLQPPPAELSAARGDGELRELALTGRLLSSKYYRLGDIVYEVEYFPPMYIQPETTANVFVK